MKKQIKHKAAKKKAAKAVKAPKAPKGNTPVDSNKVADAFGQPPPDTTGGHGAPPEELEIANLPEVSQVNDLVQHRLSVMGSAFPDLCRPQINDKGVTVFVCDKGATKEDVLRAAVAGFDMGKEAHGVGCFSMFIMGETVRAYAAITGSSQRESAKQVGDFLQEKTGRRINFATLDNWARTCEKIPPALRNYAADPSAYMEIACGIPDKRAGDGDDADSVAETNKEIAKRRRDLAKRVSDGHALERKDVIDGVNAARKEFGFGSAGGAGKKLKLLEHELSELTLILEVVMPDAKPDTKITFMVKAEDGVKKKSVTKSRLMDRRTQTIASIQNIVYGAALEGYQLGMTDPNHAEAEYMDWPFGD